MKNGQLLNLNWKFRRDFDPGYLALESYDQFETVHLPHTVKEIPDSFDEFCFAGCPPMCAAWSFRRGTTVAAHAGGVRGRGELL